MKKLSRVLIVAAAVVLGFFAYQKLFPSEETKIHRLLNHVAETVSFEPKEGNLSKLAAANKLGSYFSPEVEIAVQVPGGRLEEVQGKDEVVRLAMAARVTLTSAKVEFLDVTVAVDPSKLSAIADLTAKATIPNEKDFFVQELKIGLNKTNEEWRISRVETVRVFRQ
ncbi:MAG: hypothetical protein DME26_12595 [Verrucomicrobia bacterium]|nr:MAG: hypothetical protein DME26_12595 [Verrucomicrobiota bacterium]